MNAPRPPAAAPGWLVWTALGIVYVVWGSTYLAIRIVVETMPPLLTSGVRFMVAGAIMYATMALLRGVPHVRLTRAELGWCAVVGGALVAGGNGIVMVAERDVPSGLAALIMASIPLWVVLMRRVAGERIAGATLGGLALGFAGVALLVLPGGGEGRGGLFGLLLLVGAACSWAFGSFLSARVRLPSDPFVSTAAQMLLGGGISLAGGLVTGETGGLDLGAFSSRSLGALAYLVLIGSLVAFTAYVWLLQHAPVSRAATYAYVNPVVAIFLGWLVLDERITPTILAAAAVIVAAVAVIVRRESPREERPAPPAAGVPAGERAARVA